jgi:hypothetical protein
MRQVEACCELSGCGVPPWALATLTLGATKGGAQREDEDNLQGMPRSGMVTTRSLTTAKKAKRGSMPAGRAIARSSDAIRGSQTSVTTENTYHTPTAHQ